MAPAARRDDRGANVAATKSTCAQVARCGPWPLEEEERLSGRVRYQTWIPGRRSRQALLGLLTDGAVLLGMGNELRGDDGFGPALARALDPTPGLRCLDAGPTPENHLERVARLHPHDVIIADAACLDDVPGAWEILDAAAVASAGVTTHDIPIHMLMEYLADRCGARVRMLAVQPARVTLGTPLSPEVTRTLRRLVRFIRGARTPSTGR